MKMIGVFLTVLLIMAVPGFAAPYVDHGDGTVSDQETGLMWQKSDDNAQRSWQESLDYCNELSYPADGGYSDWRLPNIKELESIVDHTRFSPTIDPVFVGTKIQSYFSSTTHESNTNFAWAVDFHSGTVSFGGINKISHYYARCTRGGLSL